MSSYRRTNVKLRTIYDSQGQVAGKCPYDLLCCHLAHGLTIKCTVGRGWAGRLAWILYEKWIRLKLSSDEVHFTSSSLLLVKNMLCSKIHCQKGLNLIIFSYKIQDLPASPGSTPADQVNLD